MGSMRDRKAYPTDVSEEEWEFVAPYLTLFPPEATQRQQDLREVFNALRWLVKSSTPWCLLPYDLRMLLRLMQEHEPEM